ncbi:cupin domain-containing protein [Rhodobacter sp. Har01]|uniref:cupin domain-containing protein n=1 Tax=Rhodobacter sp. Har01 TaxID=2883999 RepID=UPI001D08F8EE|nr:cupin domain-containing protein [Rhodobacter sp. Har01]MCB6177303.1 cupin domain-containing protein [Rhodobacter sp. Har01]
MPRTTLVNANALPDERWDDPARGTIRFRTLISAPATETAGLVCGLAIMSEGDSFALHSHPEAEVYFGLEGEGEVLVDGVPQRLAPGVALFIPGGAVHGVPRASAPLRWFYTFAADRFDDIRYRFVHEAKDRT